ncbi:MAG TPA: amidase [Vicinamibacterales bacterium]|nr:amidase [Vicinamibacterales bacterium]
MDDKDGDPSSPRSTATAPITRRAFGQTLGIAAVAGTLQGLDATVSAQSGSPGPVSGSDELCDSSAIELAARIRRKDVSAREVMTAHLARIERVNPRVNAIVTLVAERAMDDAARADEQAARGGTLGVLHGLPVAHKDLVDTAGIRTTRGSPFYRDNVPTRDALIVTRIRAAGAITCGKTNTPEFGAGSQTFNSVFGATRNPYDVTRTCGGSSGGAAVALACGMVPIADGSDTGGSLRNPAAFCNVVGLRPSPGRVPGNPGNWSPLPVSGPMARSVADVALFLSAIAGHDPSSPLSLVDDGVQFRGVLEREFKGVRVAWWRDLGGIPFEPEIRQAVDARRRVFEDLGCIVEEAEPDFAGVDQAFPALRFAANHAQYAPLVRERPDWVKDTIKYEVAEAERMTAADIGEALARQARMYEQSREFFERYEYFVLPVTQVAPFDVNVPYPTQIAGTPMATYVDWMRSCWYVTFMSNPAMSVPAGFTASGLPIGIQIVGRHRGEWSLLQMAHAFEQATQFGKRRSPLLSA